ncbi:MAG: histidine phosphatase family protein [Deltaproteobacteria bacterium]|nr:histidine phosphatase family protein [Deltaproteobacteria bacterium]
MMIVCRTPTRFAFALLLAAMGPLALPQPAEAQPGGQALKPQLAGMALVQVLQQGGYTILLRHMSTMPFNPDSAVFDIDDCSTQRNLSESGKRQAKMLGESFQKLGIGVGEVLSSPYCRCMDTGQLAFGEVLSSDVLRVGDSRPGIGRDDPGIAIRKLLDTPPPAGKNNVLIAHSITLLYAYGLTGKPEGVAHVFRPSGLGLGQPQYIGLMKPDDWPVHAGLAAAGTSQAGGASAQH